MDTKSDKESAREWEQQRINNYFSVLDTDLVSKKKKNAIIFLGSLLSLNLLYHDST